MPVKPYESLRPVADVWEWQSEGNCVGADPELFFLEPNMRSVAKANKEKQAKAICKGCPVIAKCLNHALSVPEMYGVWGGLSADERTTYDRRRGSIK